LFSAFINDICNSIKQSRYFFICWWYKHFSHRQLCNWLYPSTIWNLIQFAVGVPLTVWIFILTKLQSHRL
jgi:hypothetical protein